MVFLIKPLSFAVVCVFSVLGFAAPIGMMCSGERSVGSFPSSNTLEHQHNTNPTRTFVDSGSDLVPRRYDPRQDPEPERRIGLAPPPDIPAFLPGLDLSSESNARVGSGFGSGSVPRPRIERARMGLFIENIIAAGENTGVAPVSATRAAIVASLRNGTPATPGQQGAVQQAPVHLAESSSPRLPGSSSPSSSSSSSTSYHSAKDTITSPSERTTASGIGRPDTVKSQQQTKLKFDQNPNVPAPMAPKDSKLRRLRKWVKKLNCLGGK